MAEFNEPTPQLNRTPDTTANRLILAELKPQASDEEGTVESADVRLFDKEMVLEITTNEYAVVLTIHPVAETTRDQLIGTNPAVEIEISMEDGYEDTDGNITVYLYDNVDKRILGEETADIMAASYQLVVPRLQRWADTYGKTLTVTGTHDAQGFSDYSNGKLSPDEWEVVAQRLLDNGFSEVVSESGEEPMEIRRIFSSQRVIE